MVQTNYFELTYVFLVCFWKPKRMVTKGGLDSVMIMCPQCMIPSKGNIKRHHSPRMEQRGLHNFWRLSTPMCAGK